MMPTISEDGVSSRGSLVNGSEDVQGLESLMVNMLDERDKLMEAYNVAQDQLNEAKARVAELEKENHDLQTQLDTSLPPVTNYHIIPKY